MISLQIIKICKDSWILKNIKIILTIFIRKSQDNEFSNWLSYFSGLKPELTGIKSNSFAANDEQLTID